MEYRTETKSLAQLYGEDYFRGRGMRILLDNPYDHRHFDQFVEKLRKVAPLTRETHVLDLACGLAQRAYYLAQSAGRVLAIDVAPFAIDFAKKNYQHDRLHLVRGDVLRLPDRAQYDLILLVSIYEHLDRMQQDQLMESVKKHLRPGGRIAVHVAIAESFLGKRKNVKNKTGTVDFTGDQTHTCKFTVDDVDRHFRAHGYVLAAEYRRLGSYVFSGKNLERIFSYLGCPRRFVNDFVVEWLGAFELANHAAGPRL